MTKGVCIYETGKNIAGPHRKHVVTLHLSICEQGGVGAYKWRLGRLTFFLNIIRFIEMMAFEPWSEKDPHPLPIRDSKKVGDPSACVRICLSCIPRIPAVCLVGIG